MFCILAQVTTPQVAMEATAQTVFLAYFIGALGTLLGAAVSGVVIWDKVRKKPSVADELHQLRTELAQSFATKAELQKVTEDIAAIQSDRRVSVARLHDKIEALKASVGANFSDVERSLGRIEGKLEGK